MAERNDAAIAGRVYVACPECRSALALPPPGRQSPPTVACRNCGAELLVSIPLARSLAV